MDLRMKFRLSLQKVDGTVYKTHSGNKRRIINKTRRIVWTEAIVEVLYYRAGILLGSNKGTYTTPEDFTASFSAFTETDLISGLY